MMFDFSINTTSVMGELNTLDTDYKIELRLEQYLDMQWIINKHKMDKGVANRVKTKFAIAKLLYMPFNHHEVEKYYQSIIIKSIKGKENERSN